MDLIDLIRAKARERDECIDTWLNGIPIRVAPDGTIIVRDQIEASASMERDKQDDNG